MSIERDIGQIPVSIGSSSPLVALDRNSSYDHKHKQLVDSISMVMFNLETLVRNVLSSIKQPLDTLSTTDVYDACLADISITFEYFRDNLPNKKLVWYIQDSKQLDVVLEGCNRRLPTTTKQLTEARLYSIILTALHKFFINEAPTSHLPIKTKQYSTRFGEYWEIGIVPYPDQTAVVGIITHMAHQLLWANKYGRLYLIESHTGTIKTTTDFSSKLSTLKGQLMLPFSYLTLNIFGDNSAVKPLGKKLRDEFLALAKKHRWNMLTTDTSQLKTIQAEGSQELKDALPKQRRLF